MTVLSRVARAGYLALAVWVAAGAGCTSGEGGETRRARRARAAQDSADGAVVIVHTPYRVVPVAGGGAVRGTVQIDGAVPPDSTYEVPEALRPCGTRIVVPAARHVGAALDDAVVWLETVREGKPLPELRRAELAHERCQVEPYVQAVVAGTTINVGNDDPVAHTARLGRWGAARPMLTIPFTAHGQVVPSETLAREAGIVEASSPELPWARAYVAVFDHPYFAVTSGGGQFAIDSVPPGRYVLKVWHPRGAEVTRQNVDIAPGEPTDAVAKITLQ